MRRPALARLLDFEEARLPMGAQNARVFDRGVAILAGLIARSGSAGDPHMLACDVLAMIRGMTDAAGERGETDAALLKKRVSRAVFGYLTGGA